MRKLLLATVAALGGLTGAASVAGAQVLSDTSGQSFPNAAAAPAPGTITVRLNGRLRFYAGVIADKSTDTTAGKQTNYMFGNYARLYPGFDGVAANGLKYGASLEIRQDAANTGAGAVNNTGAGGGVYGSISGQSTRRGQLYFRRAFGYLGTDQVGTVRFGSTDSASSLYMTGNFENFDAGGLNGDVPGFVTGVDQITWPFADVGALYTTSKAVYLSPQIFGFDTGISYEPNTGNLSINNNCTGGVGNVGCERLSSTNVNAESGRRRNTLDALLRYRGTFGGFGVAATAGYIVSSHVADNQTNGTAFASRAAPFTGRLNFDGLNVGDFGAAVTYGGLSFGGKYQFGRFNGQWSLAPRGTADGEAILGGVSYTYGPIIVGAHYLNYKSAGDISNAFQGRQRKEQGVAAGATYSLAPGLSLFLSYLWTERKQNGFNFVTGAGATAANLGGDSNHNKMTAQVLAVGTGFSW